MKPSVSLIIIERQQALIDGEPEPDKPYSGEITTLPQNFTDWVEENADKIETARSKPYFITDNRQAVDYIINPPKEEKQETLKPESAIEVAMKNSLMRGQDKDRLQKIIDDKNLTDTERIQQIEQAATHIAYQSTKHTIVSAATYYATESPVIAELQKKWLNESDPVENLKLAMELKERCAIKARWDLRRWGATPIDKITYKELSSDYQIYKGEELLTKNGTKIKTKDLIQDLLVYEDKNEIKYYYPIGVKPNTMRYKAGEASEFLSKTPSFIKEKMNIYNSPQIHPSNG